MFWLLSKLFWLVAQPVSLICLLVLAGLILTFLRRKGLGRTLIGVGLVGLFLIGFTNIGALMLQPLEGRYARPATFPQDAAGLIVLGGGTDNDVSAARSAYELADNGDRYVEAVRLALAHPTLPVLVSGGVGPIEGAGESDAASTARLFDAFDVTGPRIRYESTSRNTSENAINSAATLRPEKGHRFILVTSAFHMPRAVALFEAAGFSIVPWPVDFHTTGDESFSIAPVDASGGINLATIATREWIGLLAYWLTGRIGNPF